MEKQQNMMEKLGKEKTYALIFFLSKTAWVLHLKSSEASAVKCAKDLARAPQHIGPMLLKLH
jgi:hypothetical protein